MTVQEKTGFIIIGEGVVISGNVELPGKLVVNGKIDGLVNAREVYVGAEGEITGKIYATEADIKGRVGDFISVTDKLILRASAKITGNIEYRHIEIEQGAVVDAVLSQRTDAPKLQRVIYPNPARVLNQADFAAAKA